MENKISEETKYFNLTVPQENIWLVEQLNPNTNMNSVCGTFLIRQAWDLEILKKAINKIIENNDALRIRITEQNGVPLQFISPYEYEDIPVYFLSDLETEKKDAILDTIVLEHMNINEHKLYDLRLISTPNSVCVCIKMHHIIADAWSMGQIFIKNIEKYYWAMAENRMIEEKTSYLDYIQKNQDYRTSDKYLRDQKFWQKYVKNLTCKNEFENSKNKKSLRKEKKLDTNLQAKIENFCQENNLSEYSFFLSVIATYFSKLYSNQDLVIGTPFLNRKKSNQELNIMGMFVATLPIRIAVTSDISFVELCKQVSSTNMACFKHSNFPYREIQQEYANISGETTNLYEIAFSYQMNNLEKELDANLYKNTWISNGFQTNPLLISYVNHFGEHLLCYDYLLTCFESLDIDAMHERLVYIMQQILRNHDLKIQNIKILCETDLALLEKFNDTGDMKQTDETIVSRFEKIVSKNKSKIALKYGQTEITYKQLNAKANCVANYIIKQKIKKGSPVSIIFDKSIEMFIAMLGIMKAGCYYIPILPEEEQKRAEFIVQNSESELLITEKKYSTQIGSNVIEKRLVIDDLLNNDTSTPNISIKPSDLCYMIYTSGSTGTPKGVMLKHENVISLMNSMNANEDFKFLEGDIAISLLKYSFDASAIDIYSSLLNGGKLLLPAKEIELNPEKVVELIENEKVTRTFAVSKWLEQIQNMLQKNPSLNLSNLRIFGTGGEVLNPEKFKDIFEKQPLLKILNAYGPTETTMFVTSHKLSEINIQTNYVPIGKPIPFSRVLVLSETNNEALPINTKGELVIFEDHTSAKNIAKGYFNLDEMTQKKFIKLQNPYTKKMVKAYKTGDLVKLNHALELEFLGRKDDFKKVHGGYLVSLTEVEHKIQTILGNSIEICVVCVPIHKVNSIILYIVKKDDSMNVTLEDIQNEINNHITFYMKPKKIIEIEQLPLNKNGKINRKLLEQDAIRYLGENREFIKPANKTETTIYEIVKEIVNSDFSTTDDFEEDLGIDSLNMAMLYSKLSNHKITLQDLYTYPTVKDLAYMQKKESPSDTDITDNPCKILNASNQMDLERILLTGTTGFVGTHLLRELAENENTKKIYCIVRQKLNLSSKERFENILHTYFDEATCQKIKRKTVILNGDLRKEFLGLEPSVYQKMCKEIKTVIHTAANVKHIGKYHTFHIDNVETVNHLIKLCTEFSISLAHISTLSLNGFYNENVTEIFTENTLNIHQTFHKNPYLISKYEAEQTILKNIAEKNLNAKIFRIGNIMPRISDGTFQVNYNQNGFLLALHGLSYLQNITNEMLNSSIYLTPVDECCKAIFKILEQDYCNTIYHIEHPKKVKISNIIEIFNQRNIAFSIVRDKIFEKNLSNHYSIGVEYIHSMFGSNYNKYTTCLTNEILEQLDFTWQPIKKDYLENIINLAMKIKNKGGQI